jgi:hypothetical protein
MPKQTKSRQHARARQKRPLRLLPNRRYSLRVVSRSKAYSPKRLPTLLQSPVSLPVRAAPTKGCRTTSEPITAAKTCTGGLSSAAAISPQHHFLVRFPGQIVCLSCDVGPSPPPLCPITDHPRGKTNHVSVKCCSAAAN